MIDLLEARLRSGLSISVCLPARNEEATIGHIVGTIRRELIEAMPLITEVVVIDDASTDATAAAAKDEGATVISEASILTSQGSGRGKGNALWKSLYACQGDIICWVDADIRNFGSHFVTRLVEPLLADHNTMYSKAFYRRPLHGEPTGGGRVTELMARPLLSQLFPALSDIIQPLSGEYAGRRDALEKLPFVQGWGVEFGLLVDICEQFGRGSIAQADLGVRVHRNRPINELGAPAMAILVTALRRAGLDPFGAEAAQLIRFNDAAEIEQISVATTERPPMISIAAYRAKFNKELTA